MFHTCTRSLSRICAAPVRGYAGGRFAAGGGWMNSERAAANSQRIGGSSRISGIIVTAGRNISFHRAAAVPENHRGGVRVNLIPKDGGNRPEGAAWIRLPLLCTL